MPQKEAECSPSIDRQTCTQTILAALAVLQSVAIDRETPSAESIYILRKLAESREELAMDPEALARAIISRESFRLQRFGAASDLV